MDDSLPLTKLPFWATVQQSYRLAARHYRQYLQISWLWLLLAGVMIFCYTDMFSSYLSLPPGLDLKHPDVNAMKPFLLKSFLYSLPMNAILLLAGASIAVSWHRFILRNETPLPGHHLRLDHLVISYLALAITIDVISLLPSLLNMLMLTQLNSPALLALSGLMTLVLAIYCINYSVRLGVGLPARALAYPDLTFKDIMMHTRGNFWRLLFGPVMCIGWALIWMVIDIPLRYVVRGNIVGTQVLHAVNMVMFLFVYAPVFLTFLSLSFQHFYENRVSDKPAGSSY